MCARKSKTTRNSIIALLLLTIVTSCSGVPLAKRRNPASQGATDVSLVVSPDKITVSNVSVTKQDAEAVLNDDGTFDWKNSFVILNIQGHYFADVGYDTIAAQVVNGSELQFVSLSPRSEPFEFNPNALGAADFGNFSLPVKITVHSWWQGKTSDMTTFTIRSQTDAGGTQITTVTVTFDLTKGWTINVQ